jgi:hypothetical protein
MGAQEGKVEEMSRAQEAMIRSPNLELVTLFGGSDSDGRDGSILTREDRPRK